MGGPSSSGDQSSHTILGGMQASQAGLGIGEHWPRNIETDSLGTPTHLGLRGITEVSNYLGIRFHSGDSFGVTEAKKDGGMS